jgi:hypothetical protein
VEKNGGRGRSAERKAIKKAARVYSLAAEAGFGITEVAEF